MPWDFERVAGPFEFTEGPAYDGDTIFFSDVRANEILRYDPDERDTQVYRTDVRHSNGLTFSADGELFGCEGGADPPKEGRRIVRYNDDGTTTVIVDSYRGDRLNSPNDLVFDESGRLWLTDPRYGNKTSDLELGHESVYRVDPGPDDTWAIERVTYDTTKPNGILVSPDEERLYVAQTEPPRPDDPSKVIELRAYPIRDGSLGNYEVLHDFYPHRGVDGMCLDDEGNIVATAGNRESGPGPMIYVFDPNGTVLETHPFPGNAPTNCTFGGPDLTTLYVTGDGSLFKTETERTGYLIYP